MAKAKLMLSPLLQPEALALGFCSWRATVYGKPTDSAAEVIKDKVELILLLSQINISPHNEILLLWQHRHQDEY